MEKMHLPDCDLCSYSAESGKWKVESGKLNTEQIFPYINKKFLYHALWQITPEAIRRDPSLHTELENKLIQMKSWAKEFVNPVYEFATVTADFKSDKVDIYDNDRFLFSITHKIDLHSDKITFQIVSIGKTAVDKAHDLKSNNEYMDYFYWHGFCGALTEALADFVNTEFLTKGKRFSFGYEALPNILEQKHVLDLLYAEKIGIIMTDSGMLEPEYSTVALVMRVLHN